MDTKTSCCTEMFPQGGINPWGGHQSSLAPTTLEPSSWVPIQGVSLWLAQCASRIQTFGSPAVPRHGAGSLPATPSSFVFDYVYIYVYIYVCVCTLININIYIDIPIYSYIYIYIYTHIYIYMDRSIDRSIDR